MEVAHLEAIETSTNRLRIYDAHLHRAIVQEARIFEYVTTLKGRPLPTFVIVIMDLKMKFDLIRYGDSCLQLYWKRVISCTGMPFFKQGR